MKFRCHHCHKPLAGTWAFYTGDAEVKYLRPARR